MIESFRFCNKDNYDYEISQYWVVLAREPASFWRENVVAVVILLRVLARMSWWQEQVQSFCDRERAKLSPIKIIALTFQVKNSKMKDWTFFKNMRKHFKLNLVFVVAVLVLKSKALWRLRNERKNSIQMMRHYPDQGSAPDWLNQFVANQMLYPDLGSDALSVWNFCGVAKCRLFSRVTYSLKFTEKLLCSFTH